MPHCEQHWGTAINGFDGAVIEAVFADISTYAKNDGTKLGQVSCVNHRAADRPDNSRLRPLLLGCSHGYAETPIADYCYLNTATSGGLLPQDEATNNSEYFEVPQQGHAYSKGRRGCGTPLGTLRLSSYARNSSSLHPSSFTSFHKERVGEHSNPAPKCNSKMEYFCGAVQRGRRYGQKKASI